MRPLTSATAPPRNMRCSLQAKRSVLQVEVVMVRPIVLTPLIPKHLPAHRPQTRTAQEPSASSALDQFSSYDSRASADGQQPLLSHGRFARSACGFACIGSASPEGTLSSWAIRRRILLTTLSTCDSHACECHTLHSPRTRARRGSDAIRRLRACDDVRDWLTSPSFAATPSAVTCCR